MTSSAHRQSQRVLPSERTAPRRLLSMLDAMALAGGPERRPLTARHIAALIGVSPKSVDRSVPFLLHTDLLQEVGKACALTELAYELTRLRATDSARARLLLRVHWHDYWFHQLARKHLATGPQDEEKLATCLTAGLTGPRERGLHLIEWMTYALLLDRNQDGRLTLPRQDTPPPGTDDSAHADPFGVTDPLLATPSEQILALSDSDFIALMRAYGTVLASLTRQPAPPRER